MGGAHIRARTARSPTHWRWGRRAALRTEPHWSVCMCVFGLGARNESVNLGADAVWSFAFQLHVCWCVEGSNQCEWKESFALGPTGHVLVVYFLLLFLLLFFAASKQFSIRIMWKIYRPWRMEMELACRNGTEFSRKSIAVFACLNGKEKCWPHYSALTKSHLGSIRLMSYSVEMRMRIYAGCYL